MAHILPENEKQPLIRVNILPPTGKEKTVTDGIYGKEEVVSGIQDDMHKIELENHDRIINIGGYCMESHAPYYYLNVKYKELLINCLYTISYVATQDVGS